MARSKRQRKPDKHANRCPVDFKVIPPGGGYKVRWSAPYCSQACYEIGRRKWRGWYPPANLMDHVHKTIVKRRERRGQSKPR